MCTHTLGESAYASPHARVETKPPVWNGGRWSTGAGYERIRSWESDPTQPGDRKRDVYAYVHRLCAVAWCYPDDEPVGAILADLHGKDVHHTTGVEWANFGDSPNFEEPGLDVLEHGRHASVTQTQVRAWAADAKRAIESDAEPDPDACGDCGATDATFVRSEAFDGLRCLDCAMDRPADAPLEVV